MVIIVNVFGRTLSLRLERDEVETVAVVGEGSAELADASEPAEIRYGRFQ